MEKGNNHENPENKEPFALTQANILIPNWLNDLLLEKGRQRGGLSRSSVVRADLCELYKDAMPK